MICISACAVCFGTGCCSLAYASVPLYMLHARVFREAAQAELGDAMQSCIKSYFETNNITNATTDERKAARQSCEQVARDAFEEAGGDLEDFIQEQRFAFDALPKLYCFQILYMHDCVCRVGMICISACAVCFGTGCCSLAYASASLYIARACL